MATVPPAATVAPTPTAATAATATPVVRVATPTPLAAPATPTPVATAVGNGACVVPTPARGASGQVLLTLHQTGGFIGIDETLTVGADGVLTMGDARQQASARRSIDPADLEPLARLLASPEFGALKPLYQASGADLYTYRITVACRAASRTVTTMDGVKNPPVLDQVLKEVKRLRRLFG